MKLLQSHESKLGRCEGCLKAAAVFNDILSRVPVGEAQIQNVFAMKAANSSDACAETVDQPGKLIQRRRFENAHPTRHVLGPAARGARLRHRAVRLSARGNCLHGCHDSTSIIAVGRQTVIVGMGIDIAEVGRIKGAIERHGEVFLRRLFTAKEREYCERFKNRYERYAGRFAVKEAAMKALGTGWSRGVRWVDIEVVRQKGGRPTVALAGEARKIAERLGVKNIALSITHTAEQAYAQVIFES